MYDIQKEIKLEKLRNNQNRQNYLKLLAVSSLCIDFITYLGAETVDLVFTDLKTNFSVLIFYIIKFSAFATLALVIIISLFYNKFKTLFFSAIIYLLIGLSLFCYLIIQEIKSNSTDMQPIDSGKPELYFKVFIYITIGLNIVSGIFRTLGALFMLTFLRISYKINKLHEELGDYMKDEFLINEKNTSRSPTFLSNKISVSGLRDGSTFDSDFRYKDNLRKNFSTFAEFREQKRKFGNDSVGTNKKGEFDSKSTDSSRVTKDENKFLNKNKFNQINVHIHNYNIYGKESFKNSLPLDTAMIESTERENIGNMYETPKGSVIENCVLDRKK